jgi:hypothetical protein
MISLLGTAVDWFAPVGVAEPLATDRSDNTARAQVPEATQWTQVGPAIGDFGLFRHVDHEAGVMCYALLGYGKGMGQSYQNWKNNNPDVVLGYRPTCTCSADSVPGIVLDPFIGSGTTAEVCGLLGLSCVGLDVSHSYLDQQAKVRSRVSVPSDALDDLPLFDTLTGAGQLSMGVNKD